VTASDIARFISAYVTGRPSVLSLRMNSRDFERERGAAEGAEWTSITRDNAYWWADPAQGGVK
jgi:hypothetical protein